MPFLLVTLISFLTLSIVFDFDPGPAPGVKIKNAVLYLLALGLLFKIAMDRSYRIQLLSIPILFAVLIGYAILTFLAIVLVLDYPRYDALRNAFDMKNVLVDQMLFFLVFFYGLRSEKDSMTVLKFLLAACALAHVMAMLDALGFVQFGDIERRVDGRVQGAIGESNQYGAFVAMSLPAILALAFVTHGAWRMIWALAGIMTAVTLIMTVSRGAFVATAVAVACAFYLFRSHLPARRLAMWAGTGLIAGVLLITLVIALGFGDLLYHRLIADTRGGDLAGTSSGRTEIWTTAIGVMFEKPVSLLTGFGWRAYQSMPFRYAPHNYYLSQWFNLGLIGLTCSVLLLVLPARLARMAVDIAPPNLRPVFIGFVVGTLAFGVATFFVDIYMPWLYYWAYAGVVMRLAVNVSEQSARQVPAPVPVRSPLPPGDPFGWKGALR